MNRYSLNSSNRMGESREISYAKHLIFIKPNRDNYHGGFEWFVCKDDVESQTGLKFSVNEALNAAQHYVDII